MLPAIGMAALQGGMSLLSGLGAQRSAASQNKRQMAEDRLIREANLAQSDEDNEIRMRLGRELLDIPEDTHTTETVRDDRWVNTRTRTRSAEWGDIDVAGFMAAGEAAGFNPVTWINSGALSAYVRRFSDGDSEVHTQNGGEAVTTTHTRRTGHNAADAFKLMNPETPVLSSTQLVREPHALEAVGAAGTAALSTYNQLASQQAARDFQTSLLDRQLAAIAQRAGGGGAIAASPLTRISYGPSADTGGPAGKAGAVSSLPYPASWERGKVEVTNPHDRLKVSSVSSNAEAAEARYGDLAQEVFGMANIVDDLVLNTTGRNLRDWGRASGFNVGDYPTLGAWWRSRPVRPTPTVGVEPIYNFVAP